MADPKIGNRATEAGEFESGKDFSGINVSTLPVSGPPVEVDFHREDEDIVLTQKIQKHNRSLELRHSDTDILSAQLLEDPSVTSFNLPGVGIVQTSGSRLTRAIARNQNREQLVWFGIDSNNLSAALGDRIIVRRDSLESEYICKTCRGKGHTDEICSLCDGKQQKDGIECAHCRVLGFEAYKPHPSGFSRCSDCNGIGWKNGIIIPDAAQGKPVTGVVVSLGPETKMVKLGDRVLHSKYSGHTLEMKNETYTYMREVEVISLLRDLS